MFSELIKTYAFTQWSCDSYQDAIAKLQYAKSFLIVAASAFLSTSSISYVYYSTSIVVWPKVAYLRVVGSFPTQWTDSVLSQCV